MSTIPGEKALAALCILITLSLLTLVGFGIKQCMQDKAPRIKTLGVEPIMDPEKIPGRPRVVTIIATGEDPPYEGNDLGVRIGRVEPGSVLQQIKLHDNDVVFAINDRRTPDAQTFGVVFLMEQRAMKISYVESETGKCKWIVFSNTTLLHMSPSVVPEPVTFHSVSKRRMPPAE